MRSTTHWSTTTTLLTLVRSCVKHTSRPNAVGASSQDAHHVADASSTDVDRTLDLSLIHISEPTRLDVI
eukprot:11307619-Prorocentrum_lima.AAC.1